MAQLIKWEDVFGLHDLIGGRMEFQRDGIVYHGTLTKMRQDHEGVYFLLPRCIWFNPRTSRWENIGQTTLFIFKSMISPQNMGDGRVSFFIPFLGDCTVYPKYYRP